LAVRLRQPALAITAVPVAVGVLRDLGQLDTRLGRMVVPAAVFDDVLSLILLAVLTAVIQYMFSSIVIAASITTLAVPVLLRPMIGRRAETERLNSWWILTSRFRGGSGCGKLGNCSLGRAK
jgi:Kef-type K+ transport system membrane component KefB